MSELSNSDPDSQPAALDRLEELLCHWELGELDDDGSQELRELLRASEAARAHFAKWQGVHAALRQDDASHYLDESFLLDSSLKSPSALSQPGSVASTRQPTAWHRSPGLIQLAMIAAGILFAIWLFVPSRSSDRSVATQTRALSEPTARGVALLTELADVIWTRENGHPKAGQALEAGHVQIDEGLVQIEFFCGATVILEGPAKLELVSSTLARLHHGKVRANVPPAAQGFSIEVDEMTVLDLGTEFAVSASSGQAKVQVFDGEVELSGKNIVQQTLEAGQAVTRNAEGEFSGEAAQPSSFATVQQLRDRVTIRGSERFTRWQNWMSDLRSDSRLVVLYDFADQPDWNRRLPERSEPSDHQLDGAIVGASWTNGRWSKKRALDFKQPGDRIRINIPGEFSSLTFSAWVKIDSLDRWYNSLFLTDNYNEGEPHWQILDSGQIMFCVRSLKDDGSGHDHREVCSKPFWDQSLSGKWLHLATTYDVPNQEVRHFLNGEQIHQESIPDHQLVSPTRFGPSTIGNWTSPQRPDEDFAIRNLNGSIDEFAIFDEPLSPEEISEIYLNGRP